VVGGEGGSLAASHGTMNNARRLLAKKIALACGSTLVALLLAELGLRAVHGLRLSAALADCRDDQGKPIVVASDVPGLIYTYRPNVRGTNSRGYFDEDHLPVKPPGIFRIVVVGDSVAAGQPEGWRTSFGKLLEARLNRTAVLEEGEEYEVILLARSGYGTSQQLVLLEREAFDYDPDLVLWSYVLNDPAHPLYHDVSGGLRLVYRPRVHLWLWAGAAAYRIGELAAGWGGPAEYHARLHHVHRDEIAANVRRIAELCRERDVPCVLLIHPVFEPDKSFDQYSLAAVHRDLVWIALDADLHSIDLADAYRGYRSAELGYEDDPWHPNERGHRLAAEWIHKRLTKFELLPPEAGSRRD
jgi:lysophospholipase L1-like esterase